jgi:hypothetical protein
LILLCSKLYKKKGRITLEKQKRNLFIFTFELISSVDKRLEKALERFAQIITSNKLFRMSTVCSMRDLTSSFFYNQILMK